LSITGSLSATIGQLNSIRYRSYRFDSEIHLYYLNSRYYSPEIGRFINADGLLGPVGDILGHNVYAYCVNNPVMYTDSDGYLSEKGLLQFLSGAMIVVGAILLITGVGSAAGIVLIGAGIGSFVGGEVSEALGGSYALGWAIGGITGAIGGYYAAPAIGGFLSSPFSTGLLMNSGGVLSMVTVTGSQIVGAVGAVIGIDIMMMASQGRPVNNQSQNKQLEDIVNKLKIYDKDLIRRIHNELHKYPPMNFQELLEFVKSFLGR
jgi:RHS repeat-associated protein